MDNDYAIVFIRGERPVIDRKYDILKHPHIKLTEDGGAAPYIHYPGLTFEQEVSRMVELGRPILCTEFLARTFGNELANVLPIYAEKHIGWYLWGLCAGAAQYQYPWGWPEGSPEPKRWFHCLLYPDGTPFDDSEVPLIQNFQYLD